MTDHNCESGQVTHLARALKAVGLSLGGRRLLDVGCGTGAALVALEALGAVAPLGLDPRLPEPPAEAWACARLRPGDGAALPYAPGSFDALTFFLSLHHIPRPAQAISEAARVLRRGGLACVTEPLAEGNMYDLERRIDDEAKVRAEAQVALDDALATGLWRQVATLHYQQIEPYDDLATFVDEMLAVGGDLGQARAGRAKQHAHHLAEAFAAVPDGRFEQGYLLRVLQRC